MAGALRTTRDRWLSTAVSIQSLVAFRILFGLVMTVAMLRLLLLGWIDELFCGPKFHFTYPGFSWVRPTPQAWMYAEVAALAGCALCMALGLRYRLATALFLIGFAHLELIDQTTYLNHYYLVTLLTGILLFLPAHRAFSVDAWREPEIRSGSIPVWVVNLLRFQLGLVYLFAGIAKLSPDWLWHAQPLRIWLPIHSGLPLIGPLLAKTWVAYAASWGAAIFDLTVPFLLLYRRTRIFAFLALIGFHVITSALFSIGMFPWIMLLSVLIFFPPDWPEHAAKHFVSSLRSKSAKMNSTDDLFEVPLAAQIALASYALIQLAIPLRELALPGISAWTGTGFNFAWKVMIAEKTGYAEFYAVDPATKERWKVDLSAYITPRQAIMMAQDPHLIRALARHIAGDLEKQGHPDVQIQVDAFATLNGRRSQRIINPGVDLAGQLAPGWIINLAD